PKGIGYRGSLENALRGGDTSTMLLMLSMSLGGFPFEVTETDEQLIRELTQVVDEIVDILNDFLDKDLVNFNAVLTAGGIKVIRIPNKVV
ncbi:MAG: hypothetical protein MUP70_07025, partial [Candidatus Aminicenantes bacterium]|nr:hypothetical protein [Candidatus Aminicenantes bacterium]